VKALGRQALHAVELGFEHPTSGESMLFRADLPDDLHDILQMLDKCSKAA
jgi:23S rRNA pseudouridine1911/1915/1917 synthase